jgi:hypothetical protein
MIGTRYRHMTEAMQARAVKVIAKRLAVALIEAVAQLGHHQRPVTRRTQMACAAIAMRVATMAKVMMTAVIPTARLP